MPDAEMSDSEALAHGALVSGVPGTGHDALCQERRPVDLAALLRAAGVKTAHRVDPENREPTHAALEAGIAYPGLAAVVLQHSCPRALDKRDKL